MLAINIKATLETVSLFVCYNRHKRSVVETLGGSPCKRAFSFCIRICCNGRNYVLVTPQHFI